MAFTPVKIMAFDFDEQDNVIKPTLVQTNFNLIGQETKVLEDLIKQVKMATANLKATFDQEQISFRKQFLNLH